MIIKLDDYRKTLNVAIVSAENSLLQSLKKQLSLAGYNVQGFSSFSDLELKFSEFPPHLLLVQDQHLSQVGLKKSEKTFKSLPESLVYIYGSRVEFDELMLSIPNCHGVIPLIKNSNAHVVKALDQGAEKILMSYMIEDLQSVSQDDFVDVDEDSFNSVSNSNNSKVEIFNYEFFTDWVLRNEKIENTTELIKSFCDQIKETYHFEQLIYFKYIPSYSSLVTAYSAGDSFEKIRGLGLSFVDEPQFNPVSEFKWLKAKPKFQDLMSKVSKDKNFLVWPLESLGASEGVIVAVGDPAVALTDSWKSLMIKSLEQLLAKFKLKTKVHKYQKQDDVTGCFTLDYLREQLQKEVGRSRRILLPLSFMTIAINDQEALKKQLNEDRFNTLLKMIAEVLKKSIRPTDTLARTESAEFGVLFPHMVLEDAVKKANRLQKVIRTTQFFKDLKKPLKVSCSFSVSEYPSTAYDGEDLILSCQQKSFLNETDKSKVHIVKKSETFEPDFKAEPVRGLIHSEL